MMSMMKHFTTPASLLPGIALGLLLGLATSARADLASDMDAFFDSAGLFTNVTGAGAYEGQSAGYYTGGSIYARAPSRNINFLSVQAPSLRAGCGGIDLFAGGFGFVNSDQIVEFMESLGANALGLLFQIGLSTLSPKLASLIQYFQDQAAKINQWGMNSCEAASTLLAGVLPQTETTSQVLCANIGTSMGQFSSYPESRQNCNAEGNTNSTLQNSPENTKDQIPQGNLAWKALMKLDVTANDHDLAQMMMTLTGTVVVPPKNDNETREAVPYRPIPIDENLIDVFLHGGTLKMYYECRDGYASDQCLDIEKKTNYTIAANNGFANKVLNELQDILDKIERDQLGQNTDLTNDQKALLENTSIPVFKALSVYTGYNAGLAQEILPKYARAIAIEILFRYIDSSISAVANEVKMLSGPSEGLVNQYLEDLRDRRLRIRRLTDRIHDRTLTAIQMQREIMTVERAIISGLSTGVAQSYNWAKGIR